MKKFFFITILFLLFFSKIFALEMNEKEINILKNLRCLVCQGQSIADSNSDFAQTVKIVIRDQLKQNKNEQEIYDFLISKYGQWIAYKPEFNFMNSILWVFPYFILIIGVFLIYSVLKKQKGS